MAEQATEKESRSIRRNEIVEVSDYLNEKDAELFRFEVIGDKASGTVQAARRADTVINEKVKRNPKGEAKRHLQLLLVDDDSEEIVVNIQSQNQKDALKKALSDAGIRGLATGDYFVMEYTHDDPPLRKKLSAARGYSCNITPVA